MTEINHKLRPDNDVKHC